LEKQINGVIRLPLVHTSVASEDAHRVDAVSSPTFAIGCGLQSQGDHPQVAVSCTQDVADHFAASLRRQQAGADRRPGGMS